MQGLLPPLCLVLALALAVCGFAIWSVDGPEAGVRLHQARAAGDENASQALEGQLEQRQFSRQILLGLLFTASLGMTVLGFSVMRRPGG